MFIGLGAVLVTSTYTSGSQTWLHWGPIVVEATWHWGLQSAPVILVHGQGTALC